MLLAWHLLLQQKREEKHGDQASEDLVREWIIVGGCAAHDAHKAFLWSMYNEFHDKLLLSDIYIVSMSIRRSMDIVHDHLPVWLARNIDYGPRLSDMELSRMYAFWVALDVEPDLVHILTYELHLRADRASGRLIIRRDIEENDIVDLVYRALQTLWAIRSWTASRFLTMGSASRRLVAAMYTGIEPFVETLLSNPSVMKYHLEGFRRLADPRVRRTVVIASLASRPADAVLAVLMEDNRAALRLPELKAALVEEIEWVSDLSEDIWETLGSMVDMGVSQMRTQCVFSAEVSAAFFEWRQIHPLEGLPYSLARGDQDANLDAFRAGPQPVPVDLHTRVGLQIWLAEHENFNRLETKGALTLMLEAPKHTLIVEGLHTSAACLVKFHPEYVTDTVCSRASILQTRKLLPSEAPDEKRIRELEMRLKRLERKNPNKMRAHNIYFPTCAACCRKGAPALRPRRSRRS